jgi:subtilisin
MRNRLLIGVVLCAAAWLSFYRPAEAQGQAPVGQYIVVLHDAVPNVPAVANEHAQQHAANVRFVYAAAMKGYAASIPNARLNAIRQDPRVAFISEDRPVAMSEDSIPTGVDRIDAELGYAMEINPSILNGLEVAVIDTGSGPHADLNVVDGYNCSRAELQRRQWPWFACGGNDRGQAELAGGDRRGTGRRHQFSKGVE